MSEKDFVGKRAFVTGAGSGIGRAIAAELVARGAQVAATDLAEEGLRALEADYADSVIGIRADVTDETSVAAAVQSAAESLGGLDVAFNVAGGGRPGAIVDLAVADWDFVVSLVQKGVFLSTKHEARAMIASGSGGAIVNVASLNGHVPMPFGASYATAKAGVENFSRNAAFELAPHGIRVNTILPGLTQTPATSVIFDSPDLLQDFVDRILLGRAAVPADIAEPALFLASDAARYITAASLVVDGGWEYSNYPNLAKYLG